MARAPLPNSHWIEPGRLLAGEHPSGPDEKSTRKRLGKLLAAGIDCFFDLTEQRELESYQPLLAALRGGAEAQYLRRPIRDHGLPKSEAAMQEILDALVRALAEGRSVYLHCRAGIGRTNLVAGCWLASRGAGGEAALAQLNKAWRGNKRSRNWPRIPETDEQADYVRRWGATPAAPPPPAPVSAASPEPARPEPVRPARRSRIAGRKRASVRARLRSGAGHGRDSGRRDRTRSGALGGASRRPPRSREPRLAAEPHPRATREGDLARSERRAGFWGRFDRYLAIADS